VGPRFVLRSGRVGLALAALLAATGCFSQFGDYAGTGGAGGRDTTESASTTTGEVCPVALLGPEDCLDGCDNDADGDVDCADADCGDFLCVPAFPAGWDGPAVLSDSGTQPACPAPFDDGTSRVGEEIGTIPPATCTCSCAAAAGGVCAGSVTLLKYTTSDCSDAPSTLFIPAEPTCSGMIPNIAAGKATLTPTVGTCAPSGAVTTTDVEKPERAFCAAARSGGGCGDGVCVPRPKAGFEDRICVIEPGEVACTGADYAVRTVVYSGGIDDQRVCPDCGCGAPTGASCNGLVTLYTNGSCTAPFGGVFLTGSCDGLPTLSSPTGSNYKITSITQGTCAPAELNPPVVGEVVGTDAVTICCSGGL
jgi:hypothetical protein